MLAGIASLEQIRRGSWTLSERGNQPAIARTSMDQETQAFGSWMSSNTCPNTMSSGGQGNEITLDPSSADRSRWRIAPGNGEKGESAALRRVSLQPRELLCRGPHPR